MWKPSKKDPDFCRDFIKTVVITDANKDTIKKIKFLKDLKKIVSCFEKKVEVKADTYKKIIKAQDEKAMGNILLESVKELGEKLGKATVNVDTNIQDYDTLDKIGAVIDKNLKKGFKTDEIVVHLHVKRHAPTELRLLKEAFTPAKAKLVTKKIDVILQDKANESDDWFTEETPAIIKNALTQIVTGLLNEEIDRMFPNKGPNPVLHDAVIGLIKSSMDIYLNQGKEEARKSKARAKGNATGFMEEAIIYAAKRVKADPATALKEFRAMVKRNK